MGSHNIPRLPGLEPLENRTLLSAAPAAQLIRLDGKAPTAADSSAASVWVVIPGMGGSPTGSIRQVASAIDGTASNDRVFLLDWRKTGNTNGKNADINAVALAAAKNLQKLGIGARKLNLVAYSLGAPIAARLAQIINHGRQVVGTLVALDPAAPRDVNPGQADHGRPVYTLADKARFSVAFYANDGFSHAPRAASAKVTIRVDNLGSTDLARHQNIPVFFANMITAGKPAPLAGRTSHKIAQFFSAQRLSPATAWPWRTNAFSGVYEGIVTATYRSNAFSPSTLDYIDRATGKKIRATDA